MNVMRIFVFSFNIIESNSLKKKKYGKFWFLRFIMGPINKLLFLALAEACARENSPESLPVHYLFISNKTISH